METLRLATGVGTTGTGVPDGEGALGRLFRFSVEKSISVFFGMWLPVFTWWEGFGGLPQGY
jgi:hypothetical protein